MMRQEKAMPQESTQQFEIPNEMRAFAEQGVAQARKAFDSYIAAASNAVNDMEGRTEVARHNAVQIVHKCMDYATENVSAAFEFAEKMARARDGAEVMQLQAAFLSRQVQTLFEQARNLGQDAAKAAMKTTGNGQNTP
jgi:phasin